MQVKLDYKEEDTKQDVKLRDISQRCKSLREDVASTIRQAEPVRVKIFEGGYEFVIWSCWCSYVTVVMHQNEKVLFFFLYQV